MPAIVTIGNGPSSGDGTYINAADLAAQMALGPVVVSADAGIIVETAINLSVSNDVSIAGSLTLQAPAIQVSGNVQVGTGAVVRLNAADLVLDATFTSASGQPLSSSALSGTATTVFVQSASASIQQAIDASNFTAPVAIHVAPGDYIGAIRVTHALSLLGIPGAAAGAGETAPAILFGPGTSDILVNVTAANVAISGFVLDATGSAGVNTGIGGTASNLTISSNSFIGFINAGVQHLFANGATIENNYFEQIVFDAIREVSGTGLVIRGNVIEGDVAGEFGAGRHGIFVGDSFGAQITGNIVRGVNGGSGAGQVGVLATNVDGGTISGNTVAGLLGGRGAFLHDYDFSRTDGATVTNNLVDSDGATGSIGAVQANIVAPAFAALREDTGIAGDGVSTNGVIDVTLAANATSWRFSTDGGATWTVGVGTSFTLANGTYAAGAIQVDQSDANGNTNSAYQLGAITVVEAQLPPPSAALAFDTGISSSDGITNRNIVNVTLSTAAVGWEYSVDFGATWTTGVEIPGAGNFFDLRPGTLNATYAAGAVQVRQLDSSGNASPAFSLGAITLDRTDPALPGATLREDTGVLFDGITSNGVVDIVFAADVVLGAIFVNGVDTVLSRSGGSVTFTLPEGTYGPGQIRVVGLDVAGNGNFSFSSGTFLNRNFSLTIDQTVAAPGATLREDTGVTGDGVTTNGAIDVTLASDVLTWRYTTDGGATWATGAGTSFVLPAGVYAAGAIQVEQSDIAGNISAPNSLGAISIVTETLPPPTAALAVDSGISSTDGITNSGQVNVALAVNAVSWQYSVDGGANWTVGQGASFQLGEGVYEAGAVQLRQAGATGVYGDTFSLGAITIDTTGDAVATFALREDTEIVGDLSTSNGIVDVTLSPGATSWRYSIDFGATWTQGVDSSFTLAQGSYFVRAVQVQAADIAGNWGTIYSIPNFIVIQPPGVTLTGTAGANTLTGTASGDTLRALAGNDTLVGGTGNDILDGGAGDDRFLYTIGDGGDAIIGGAGADRLIITDTAGVDFLQVTVVGNRITGINDNNTGVMGTVSGVEIATLTVTGPDDFLSYGRSAGPVTVDLQARTATGFTTITGLRNVQGGSGDDRLFGNALDNFIYGGLGADRIEGRRGNDTMSGLEGNDTLVYNVGDGDDNIDGGEGIDTLQILGTAGNDRVDISLINWFTGPAVYRLQGGYVDPEMEVVTLNMGNGVDTLSYASTASPSAVAATVNLQTATATGFTSIAGVENVVGGNGADTLIGNGAVNQLSGGGGADVLRGFGGNDVLTGGGGDDNLSGGAGNDRFVFRSGDGRDTITDFVPGASSGDTIQLLGYGQNLDSFAEVRAATFQVGANTVIDLGNGELITLTGVNAATLNAGDFLFGP